jgi:tRNA A37 threonylcarbamoyladenosine dehydratase
VPSTSHLCAPVQPTHTVTQSHSHTVTQSHNVVTFTNTHGAGRLGACSKNKASYYGTCAWIPALFGIHAAATVLRDIADGQPQSKRAAKLRKAGEHAARQH